MHILTVGLLLATIIFIVALGVSESSNIDQLILDYEKIKPHPEQPGSTET